MMWTKAGVVVWAVLAGVALAQECSDCSNCSCTSVECTGFMQQTEVEEESDCGRCRSGVRGPGGFLLRRQKGADADCGINNKGTERNGWPYSLRGEFVIYGETENRTFVHEQQVEEYISSAGSSHKGFVIPEYYKPMTTPTDDEDGRFVHIRCPDLSSGPGTHTLAGSQFGRIETTSGLNICTWRIGNGRNRVTGKFRVAPATRSISPEYRAWIVDQDKRQKDVLDAGFVDGGFLNADFTYRKGFRGVANITDKGNKSPSGTPYLIMIVQPCSAEVSVQAGNSHKGCILAEGDNKEKNTRRVYRLFDDGTIDKLDSEATTRKAKVSCHGMEGPGLKAFRGNQKIYCTYKIGNGSDTPSYDVVLTYGNIVASLRDEIRAFKADQLQEFLYPPTQAPTDAPTMPPTPPTDAPTPSPTDPVPLDV